MRKTLLVPATLFWLTLLIVNLLVDGIHAASFVVRSSADAGKDSLREVITKVNASSGGSFISFQIPAAGPVTIFLQNDLPTITQQVTIDGSTQSGYSGVPLIELSGAGGQLVGLWLTQPGCVIRALSFTHFTRHAINLGGNNVVEGCYFGVSGSAGPKTPNSAATLFATGDGNRIGGSTDLSRNVLAGGLGDVAAYIDGNKNVIERNLVGTDSTGSQPLKNLQGLFVLGDANVCRSNLVSGNIDTGIYCKGNTNLIEGNRIGTDAGGTATIANKQGLRVIGHANLCRSNLVSGNLSFGIECEGNTNRFDANRIGTDSTGTYGLGGGNGITIYGDSNMCRSNLFSGTTAYGIYCTGSTNWFEANRMGTDLSGTLLLTNSSGISANGDHNLLTNNLISGSTFQAVSVTGTNNILVKNILGADIFGREPITNARSCSILGNGNLITNNLIYQYAERECAISIYRKTNIICNNIVGLNIDGRRSDKLKPCSVGIQLGLSFSIGTDGVPNLTDATRIISNTIAGNRTGIYLARDNSVVEGNVVGRTESAETNVGNDIGICVCGNFNTIGGAGLGKQNLVSGNSGVGIDCSGVSNRIDGNIIGLSADGKMALGNGTGIQLREPWNQVISNVISANHKEGVLIRAPSNSLTGNWIGTDRSGVLKLGNLGDGISVVQLLGDRPASGSRIGSGRSGDLMQDGNTIAFNQENGIRIASDGITNVTIRGNRIYGNKKLPIALGTLKPDDNDIGDTDAGANELLNTPRGLTSVYDPGTRQSVIAGRVDTKFPSSGLVDIYSIDRKQGETDVPRLLGTVTPDDTGWFSLTLSENLVGADLVATITSADGSTSEVSPQVRGARLVALEVTQSVQDLKQSVPLILHKKTLVRAYIESKTQRTIPVTGLLHAYSGARELPGSPVRAMNHAVLLAKAHVASRRADLDATLNFEFLDKWMDKLKDGVVDLWLDAGEVECIEKPEIGNPADGYSDCSIRVTFQKGGVPDIRFIGISWVDSNGETHLPEDYQQVLKYVGAMYPVSEQELMVKSGPYRLINWNEIANESEKGFAPNVNKVVEAFSTTAFLDHLADDLGSFGQLYHCIVGGSPPNSTVVV